MFKKIIKIMNLLLDDAASSLENSRKLREEQEKRHLEFEREFEEHEAKIRERSEEIKQIVRGISR